MTDQKREQNKNTKTEHQKQEENNRIGRLEKEFQQKKNNGKESQK